MSNLAVSDVTWDGFTASWTPAGGEFDSFVIEITNLENLEESRNLTLSGGALSLAVSGLKPNTSYMLGLFGVYRDSILEPVFTEATTGTRSCWRAAVCPLASFPLFIFYSSSFFALTGTSLPPHGADLTITSFAEREPFNKHLISRFFPSGCSC